VTGQETLSDSAFGEARLAAIYIVTRGGFTPYLPAVRGTVWPADNRSFAAQPWGKSPFALAAPMYLVSRIGEGSFAFRPDGGLSGPYQKWCNFRISGRPGTMMPG